MEEESPQGDLICRQWITGILGNGAEVVAFGQDEILKSTLSVKGNAFRKQDVER